MNIPLIQAVSEGWQKGAHSVQKGSNMIQNVIQKALEKGCGALIGRHGTIELSTLLVYNQEKNFNGTNLAILEKNAGVFPSNPDIVKQWLKEYKLAAKEADGMAAGWYAPLARAEWMYLYDSNPVCPLLPLRSLEPYYTESNKSWLRALDEQRVAVVSSFAYTMESQVNHLYNLWPGRESMLPKNVSWTFIRSYYSPVLAKGKCQWPESVTTCMDAIEFLENQVVASGCKICLLGCGGLAMPLALRLKRKGIVCIVMGGAIQLLFGIKGRRWEKHPAISSLFTEDWVFPHPSEIPGGAREVEGGCYW
jgi:hypothetical protein